MESQCATSKRKSYGGRVSIRSRPIYALGFEWTTVMVDPHVAALREVLASNTTLVRRLETLERSVAALNTDTRKQFDQVYEAILGLMGSGPRRN